MVSPVLVPGIGVDTVRVAIAGELRALPRDNESSSGHGLPGQNEKRRRRLFGGGVVEWPYLRPGARCEVWAEASLPRRVAFAGGAEKVDNVTPVAFGDLAAAVGELVAEVEADGVIRDVSGLAVNRVDVCRDFSACENGPGLIASLASVAPPGDLRMQPRVWHDRRRHRAATLTVANGVWGGTLYDKSVESGLAPGHLRYEARFRREALRRFGVLGVGDAEGGGLVRVARGLFNSLGWGAAVQPLDEVIAELTFGHWDRAGAKEVSRVLRRNLIGYAAQRRAGVVPEVAAPTLRRYERLLKLAGVASDLSELVKGEPAAAGVRLSWDEGRPVAV